MDVADKKNFMSLDLADGGMGKRTLKPLDLARQPKFELKPLELGQHEKPNLVAGSLDAMEKGPLKKGDAHAEAQRFVSQAFFATILKQMRNSPFKSELFSGGRAGDAYGSLYDQQLADRMARGVGNKLVNSIVRKLEAAKAYRKTSKQVIERSGSRASAH